MDKEIIEYVDITPHKSIMPKMGRAGYSFAQAIAELIDNSIDAKDNSEKLKIDITIDKEKIVVKDNGIGMGKEELTKAFSLAHSNKKDKLGEFGLGLKTACQSLGEEFNISTTKKGNKNFYLIEYDEKEWLKNEHHDWSKYPLKILKNKDIKSHSTTILIKKLRNKRIEKYVIEKVKKDIGNRFSPFIIGEEVIIKINDSITKPFIPELTEEGKTNFEIKVQGKRIYGWYGLMKEGSQKGFYGFNIFRRGRMITCYDKIGIPEHATIARIIGEIHLDHVPVTHNKREFIKDSEEYIFAEEALSKQLKEIVRKARKKAKDEKVTSKVKEEVDIWKEKIMESLKTSELKDLLSPIKKEKEASQKGKKKDFIDIEKRDEWKLQTPPIQINESQKVKERKPKRFHKKRHTITIRNKRFNFKVEYAHFGKDSSWKKWSVSEINGIEIFINTDFPAWLSTKDTPFYVVVLVAEALAEIICKESNEYTPEKISEYKEEILRKSSELKNQFEEEVEIKVDELREATSFIK